MVDQPMSQSTRAAKIAALNDALRNTIHNPGKNRVMMTAGIASLIGDTSLFRGFHNQAEFMRTIRDFDRFTQDNDPHAEHDFGAFEFLGAKCFWQFAYYDLTLEYGSEDPTDPEQTIRVLTIMLADEY